LRFAAKPQNSFVAQNAPVSRLPAADNRNSRAILTLSKRKRFAAG
jgi:hypothetical protein